MRQLTGLYNSTSAPSYTDINFVISEALVPIQGELIESGIQVKRTLDSELPRIFVSTDNVKRVLYNLFLNAKDATSNGGRLNITTQLSTSDDIGLAKDKFILIEMGDTGKGIMPAEIAQIFTPFYSTKENGVGLGLWISKRIIEDIGGQILVRSVAGQGSTFTIALPIER